MSRCVIYLFEAYSCSNLASSDITLAVSLMETRKQLGQDIPKCITGNNCDNVYTTHALIVYVQHLCVYYSTGEHTVCM